MWQMSLWNHIFVPATLLDILMGMEKPQMVETIGKDRFDLYQMKSLHSEVSQSLRNVWRTLLWLARFARRWRIPNSQNTISGIPPCPTLHLLPLHVPDVLSTSLGRVTKTSFTESDHRLGIHPEALTGTIFDFR